jgi:hypothetical protein
MLIGTVAYSTERDVVVYLRIPKTGSSSLSRMLEDAFGPERTAELPDRQVDSLDHGPRRLHDQLRRWGMRRRDGLTRLAGGVGAPRHRRADAAFLQGHHPIWARLPSRRRPLFITMTRDPVERFLSNYYFVRARAERGGRSRLKRAALAGDPDEFARAILRSPAAARLNGMCLYLARSGRFEDARAALESRVFAAAPLDEIGAFGRLLAAALSLPEPPVRHENASRGWPRDNPLSARVEAALRAALDPDRRLHDHVGASFQRLLDDAARHG